MATSAAYIAGLATDHIVARGNTVTGSVGVIFQWADVSQLLDKLGVKMNEVKSGTLKAVPSMFAPLDEQGRKLTEEMVAELQRWFVGLVTESPQDRSGQCSGPDPRADLLGPAGRREQAGRWRSAASAKPCNGSKPSAAWPRASPSSTGNRGPSTGWGLLGALGPASDLAIGAQGREILARFADNGGLARLPLDGLVSVWHAGGN